MSLFDDASMNNNTEVIFENIEERILKEIQDAHYAIFVSVAWFTNKRLFNALLEKAKSNCYVSIIIQLDDINSQCGIDYSQIQIGRSECLEISKDTELLHDKFCVIDFKKVITGSYNWTYKASYNSENILILNDPSVATQYISRFEQQKVKFNSSNTSTISSLATPLSRKLVNVHKTVMPSRHCCSCGFNLATDDAYCPYCGAKQSTSGVDNYMICNKCFHKQFPPILSRTTQYCTKCGNRIAESELTPNKCPICKNNLERSSVRNFCPSCGLADSIYTLPSDDVLKTGFKRLDLKYVRPEFQSFYQYQRCYKCNAVNEWEVNYCRACGENISLHAKDKYEHEWVDLGLSVLWSTQTIDSFKYRWMDAQRFTLYGDFRYLRNEQRANKDIASERLGQKWRMPTKQEVEELIEKCEWETIVRPPHNYLYLKITGPNGNNILLPVHERPMSNMVQLRFWTSTVEERGRAFAFDFSTIYEESRQIGDKRKCRLIRAIPTSSTSSIIPVADKKWTGRL